RTLEGLVGPYCSTASLGAASYASSVNIPQISFASTASELSDKNDYGSFARTCLPDSVQGYLLSDILYKLRLYDVAVVYTDDDYSSSLAKLFVSSYEERNGTVLKQITFASKSGENATFYEDIMDVIATTGAPGIVLVTTASEAQKLLVARASHPVMRSDKFLWAGVDDWIGSDDVSAPAGTIGLVPQPFDDTEFDVGQQFMDLWKSLDSTEYPDADGDRTTLSTYTAYAVDAVFGMALAHQAVIDSNFDGTAEERNKEAYLDLLGSVFFIGVTGQVDFDASGDRLYAHYDILNVDSGGT
ncbi:unnamed protein product, partial [Ectocarpus fasciculatus]